MLGYSIAEMLTIITFLIIELYLCYNIKIKKVGIIIMEQEILSILKSIQSDVSDVKSRVKGLETRFDKLELRFDKLELRFNDLERQVQGISEQVKDLCEFRTETNAKLDKIMNAHYKMVMV